MRIGIVAFPYDDGKSGIWDYIKNIVSAVAAVKGTDEYYIFTAHDFGFNKKGITQVLFNSWVNSPVINILWHQFYLPYAVKRFGIDVLHLPAGNRRLLLIKLCKIVATVHDLAQFHIKGKYGALRSLYVKKVLRLLIGNSDKVIAISESTRKDILKYWGVDDARVVVIPNGLKRASFSKPVNSVMIENILAKYKIQGRYILYVSRLEHPGKNHNTLIEAYEKIKRSVDLPHKLVLAGGAWDAADRIYERAEKSEFRSEIIFPGYVPEEDLACLYSGADLFVFPSLFEGFGIPLLEAMASGVPVVCSNTSSLPEVLGGCGLTFDPRDPDDIAKQMKTVLTSEELRGQYVKLGLERARQFDWCAIVAKTINIYKQCA